MQKSPRPAKLPNRPGVYVTEQKKTYMLQIGHCRGDSARVSRQCPSLKQINKMLDVVDEYRANNRSNKEIVEAVDESLDKWWSNLLDDAQSLMTPEAINALVDGAVKRLVSEHPFEPPFTAVVSEDSPAMAACRKSGLAVCEASYRHNLLNDVHLPLPVAKAQKLHNASLARRKSSE